MRRLVCLSFVVLAVVSSAVSPSLINAQSPACDQFDSWIWAQSVFESNSAAATTLDPDGNGIACDALRPIEGFAPALWTDQIPDGLTSAEVISITDGDTFDAMVNGVRESIRIYRADTPETYFNPQCGGAEATAFTFDALLRWNDQTGVIYLEQDVTLRDPHGRLLAYVWFTVDDHPYMLNEALIRSGWAADINYGDEIYDQELVAAEAFAERHKVGAWHICPQGPNPPDVTPDAPDVPEPGPEQSPTDCDASYPDVCIPPVWVYGDLDCKHVQHRRFAVLQPDPHRFDGDGNGVGCESYDTPYVGLP